MHVVHNDGIEGDPKPGDAYVIEPGHDAWVVGDEQAVFVELDYEGDTVRRLGLPEEHRH